MRTRGLQFNSWDERLQWGIATLLQLAILVLVVGTLVRQHWVIAFSGSVVLALTFLPAVIERRLHVHLPVEFSLATCVFLYASFGLGEVSHFYARFRWWDLMLHNLSALVIGLTGFLMIYVFYMTHRLRMAPIYVAGFSFCLAVTTGALWKVFEFLMDWFFGFSMQRSGLVDTMTDLLVNTGGGLIAAFIGYTYVKDGDSLIATRMIRHFVAQNPEIFREGTKETSRG